MASVRLATIRCHVILKCYLVIALYQFVCRNYSLLLTMTIVTDRHDTIEGTFDVQLCILCCFIGEFNLIKNRKKKKKKNCTPRAYSNTIINMLTLSVWRPNGSCPILKLWPKKVNSAYAKLGSDLYEELLLWFLIPEWCAYSNHFTYILIVQQV